MEGGAQGGKGDAIVDPHEPIKREFIDNLHRMLHLYNSVLTVSPQFNPVEGLLRKGASSPAVNSENILLDREVTGEFKTAPDFTYEKNPYDRETLQIKHD